MLLIGSVEYLPNHFCSFFWPFLSGYMALFANELMISDHKTQGTTYGRYFCDTCLFSLQLKCRLMKAALPLANF